jgi:hypothetical protein
MRFYRCCDDVEDTFEFSHENQSLNDEYYIPNCAANNYLIGSPRALINP